jgi:hypothetical protein
VSAASIVASKAIKLAGAAIEARSRGDMEQALMLAREANSALLMAKALGYVPAFKTRPDGEEIREDTEISITRSDVQTVIKPAL